eukprot:m.5216 g.5216  ORF g.5216 m.5216 type:complete len:336 (-) comp4861_c1_seq1:258-1265(-)
MRYTVYKEVCKALDNVTSDGELADTCHRLHVSLPVALAIKGARFVQQAADDDTRARSNQALYASQYKEAVEQLWRAASRSDGNDDGTCDMVAVEVGVMASLAEQHGIHPFPFSRNVAGRLLFQCGIKHKHPDRARFLKQPMLATGDGTVATALRGSLRSSALGFYLFKQLQVDVEDCMMYDEFVGPCANRSRHERGLRGEYMLKQGLDRLGIQFVSEHTQRQIGVVTTPDVRLLRTVLFQGAPIKWIDSKYKFGSEAELRADYQQAQRYLHDIGPGLVIYWMDYLEDVPESIEGDDVRVSAWAANGVYATHGMPKLVQLQGSYAQDQADSAGTLS